jgi:hypothetical protein
LLNYPENDPLVIEEKKRIMTVGAVPQILSSQNPGGFWGKSEDFYMRSKYKGTVWNVILLAELGVDNQDKHVRKVCQFILEHVQDSLRGGIVYRHGRNQQPDPKCVIPCLSGNMIYSLIRLGYLDDPRVQHGLEWLATYLRFAGEQQIPDKYSYSHLHKCFSGHSCYYGIVKGLKALAEVPQMDRSPGIELTTQRATEYILKHHIFKKSHDLNEIAISSWLQLGFPRMWDTDILEILEVLITVGLP